MSLWIWFWAMAALGFLLLRRSTLPTEVFQTHRWLIQAGYRDAFHVNYYFGARILLAAVGFADVALFSGFDNPFLLAAVPAFGFFTYRTRG